LQFDLSIFKLFN